MRSLLILTLIVSGAGVLIAQPAPPETPQGSGPMPEVKIITLDPGHFHAALVQKRMYPDVSKRVSVYAPLGFDLTEHLNRIARFNMRAEDPTSWELDIRTGPDFFDRMLKERPGNVVVISGRNRGKINKIAACIDAGLNVLADKPWIINAADLPRLEKALNTADRSRLAAYDIMTERYEITTILQRELLADAATFGSITAGSEREPAVYFDGVHHLMKTVAGVPNLRPAWFFDITQQGEGIADTGTHLVDLVQWMLFPEQPVDRKEINVISAKRWPTTLSKAEFRRVTGEPGFPGFLSDNIKEDQLKLFCNGQVSYTVRGIHATVKESWNYEAPEGTGDTHFAVFRGSKSRIEIRQGKEQLYRTELYVVPNAAVNKTEILAALKKRVEAVQARYPGVAVEEKESEFIVRIPDRFRVGHEDHFAQVAEKFLGYLKHPGSLPSWEK